MSKNDDEHGRNRPFDVIEERSVLLGLSYRLLGSLADAEDTVQETYFRWYRLPAHERAAIASPRAWLIKTATRIGLDVLKSARVRRERYVGEWLPEPAPAQWRSYQDGLAEDPADRVSLDESVSMALLIVLEAMTPAERVCFVLHDVFAYSFPEIAEIVDRPLTACRQLATSARRHVARETRTSAAPAEHAKVVRSFKSAWETGDLAAHPAFQVTETFIDADVHEADDSVTERPSMSAGCAVEESIALFTLLGWPPDTARAAIEHVCGTLTETGTRHATFEALRRDSHARALLDLPRRSWSALLKALLGNPDPALSATKLGRGVLLRLLIGEDLASLLHDDDLVLAISLTAPSAQAHRRAGGERS